MRFLPQEDIIPFFQAVTLTAGKTDVCELYLELAEKVRALLSGQVQPVRSPVHTMPLRLCHAIYRRSAMHVGRFEHFTLNGLSGGDGGLRTAFVACGQKCMA